MFYAQEELDQPIKFDVEIDKFEDMDEALYYLQFGVEATLDFASDNLPELTFVSVDTTIADACTWAINEWEVMTTDEANKLIAEYAGLESEYEQEYLYLTSEGNWLLINEDELVWNVNSTIEELYTLDELKDLLKAM